MNYWRRRQTLVAVVNLSLLALCILVIGGLAAICFASYVGE